MRVQKTYSELKEHFQSRGMEAEFWRSEADYLLHLMVKPDLSQVRTPLRFVKEKVISTRTSWYNKWWARFLRWAVKIRDNLIRTWPDHLDNREFERTTRPPDWLRDLLHSSALEISYDYEELSTEVLERVRAQLNYLSYRGIKPSKILMGPKAKHNLEVEAINYGYCSEPCPEGWYVTLFGLRAQESPFLAEDAVIVC